MASSDALASGSSSPGDDMLLALGLPISEKIRRRGVRAGWGGFRRFGCSEGVTARD